MHLDKFPLSILASLPSTSLGFFAPQTDVPEGSNVPLSFLSSFLSSVCSTFSPPLSACARIRLDHLVILPAFNFFEPKPIFSRG